MLFVASNIITLCLRRYSKPTKNVLRILFSRTFLSQDLLEYDEHGVSGSRKLAGKGKQRYTREKNQWQRAVRGEILFGVHPVSVALQSSRRQLHKLYVRKESVRSCNKNRRQIENVAEKAKNLEIPIKFVNTETLDNLCFGRPHQGLCMDASALDYQIFDIDEQPFDSKSQFLVVLDRVKDPMNLGAVLRSAYFLGVGGVVVTEREMCPLTPVVSKASSGVTEVWPVHKTPNVVKTIQMLREKKFRIVGAVCEHSGSKTVSELCASLNAEQSSVLIIGSEGFGLDDSLLRICDDLVRIPSRRGNTIHVDSLNLSVAAGILMHSMSEVLKK